MFIQNTHCLRHLVCVLSEDARTGHIVVPHRRETRVAARRTHRRHRGLHSAHGSRQRVDVVDQEQPNHEEQDHHGAPGDEPARLFILTMNDIARLHTLLTDHILERHALIKDNILERHAHVDNGDRRG